MLCAIPNCVKVLVEDPVFVKASGANTVRNPAVERAINNLILS